MNEGNCAARWTGFPTVNAVDSALSGWCGGVIADRVEEDVLNWAGEVGLATYEIVTMGRGKSRLAHGAQITG